MKLGASTLVLHSHIPYVRRAGGWPHGEEMLHEVMAESYIPLLNALFDLKQDGLEPCLTLDLTPILLEQMADREVLDHFEVYLEERQALAEAEIAVHDRRNESHLAYLARWYRDWYANILTSFRQRYARDLVGAFRRLAEAGNLEMLTSAATHAYLPLLERDSSLYAQLKTGIESSRRLLGRAPRGVWLPECGYRPAYVADWHARPGIEEFLADLNLGFFFTESTVLTGACSSSERTGRKASAGILSGTSARAPALGSTVGLPQRKLIVRADERPEAKTRTTMEPYYVHASHVVVLARDEKTGQQVWSSAQGYPADFVYREFHRKDANSGLRYWRITAANTDLDQKEYYDPYPAFERTRMHADHFVDLVTQLVRGHYYQAHRPGIVVAAYDTELFGHWWFEGVAWLKHVLQQLSRSPDVDLTTISAYLEANPPNRVVALPESSWGDGNDHSTWLNTETAWMWPLIHSAGRVMESLVANCPNPGTEHLAVLNQAARELLLLESSDWPFLISTGQAKDYAANRFQQHLARFHRLAALAQQRTLGEDERRFLANVVDQDNPFPNIDYRSFAAYATGG
jgi:1,4-alpha-glucan branching enzyme